MKRWLRWLWLAGIVCVVALYFRHLRADFPNYSPWSDWSKFTDEGWYGDAAIRHALFGRWDVPGDFNPAAALPVLPAFEAAVFHFTGVSLVAARALSVSFFAAALLAIYLLMRRFQSRVISLLAVTLLVLSPFNYAFMRLAILEPPVILFSALLLLAAEGARWRRWWRLLACGVLLAVVALTKTTAVVIVPAALYLMWRANDQALGRFLRCVFLSGCATAVVAGGYLWAVHATGHGLDFRYLFIANAQPILTLHSRWDAVRGAVWDAQWADRWLYPAALVAMLLSAAWLRRMWRNPLFGACVLWVAGYLVFIAWHCNLQPRYYLPVLPPVVIVLCIVLEHAWRGRKRLLSGLVLWVMLGAVVHNVPRMVRWMDHPEYSYWDAAQSLAGVIERDPQQNRLLMSISGSQITLMTGVRSICDDFGTDELETRLMRYNPGWYASWDDVDPGTLESLVRFYRLERVAAWPAMDDPERRVLVLWRLVPR